MPVPPIQSVRLDLVSMSSEMLQAALDRSPTAETMLGALLPSASVDGIDGLFRRRLKQMGENPALQPWLLRAMVVREPAREVVGFINFHGAPDERGALEVGYRMRPEFRRRGYAEEAVRALFAWAHREHGVVLFIASIAPGNAPSLGLAGKLGFVQTGVQMDDEDGEELVFELRWDTRDARPAPSDENATTGQSSPSA